MKQIKQKASLYEMAAAALMAALMCCLGPISLPIGPVPISLTSLVVYLAVVLLGWRLATVSCGVYLLLGMAGLPVFSGFQGGLSKLAGPTGGYLVGFLFVALVGGSIMERFGRHTVATLLGLAVATLLLYAFGSAWFILEMRCDPLYAFSVCVVPFLPFDLIKIGLAVFWGKTIRSALEKNGLLPNEASSNENR